MTPSDLLHTILEYHNMQVIKHPMDLGTIKKRIDEGFYCNVKEMCNDMRLVFANAIKYNQAGTDVYFMAIKLSSEFEDWWFPLAPKVQEPEQVCNVRVSNCRSLGEGFCNYERCTMS